MTYEDSNPCLLRDALPPGAGTVVAAAPVHVRLMCPADGPLGDDAAAWVLGAWLLLAGRLCGRDRLHAHAASTGACHGLDLLPGTTARAWVQGLQAWPGAAGPVAAQADFVWQADDITAPASLAHAPLALAWARQGGSAELHLWHDAAALQADMALPLLALWAAVLAKLLAHPCAALADINPVPDSDLARQAAWQGPPWVAPPSLSVVSLFDMAVARYPQAVALRDRGHAVHYQALQAQSQALASHLAGQGLAPGAVAALALPRGAQAVVAMLAVLRCGAAYMPLDASYPAERLAYMLADSGAQLAVVDADSRFALPPTLAQVRVDAAAGASAPLPRQGADGESAAYLMYTSGSTGRPKGVRVPQRAVARLVHGCRFMQLDDSVVMLQAAPLGFDASTLEIWGPLLNGGCCVVHDEAVPSGAGLARAIAEQGVTSAWLTAALFNAIVDDNPAHLSGLRELLTGGEALSVPHVVRAQRALPGVQLINGYGPTETTTFAATWRIPPGFDPAQRSVPIGTPIQATSLAVLNPRGEPLPSGFVGELVIGGLGVALGYHGKAELSAQRFTSHAGAPAYRTGDRVRWLPEAGTIEFLGRADGQVKIRGYRIEVGEIEAALAQASGVKACAVHARADADRGTELVAYVVPDAASGHGWQPAAWHAALAQGLPEFMLPAHWVSMAALPVTANGKLDRAALPAPARERPPHLTQAFVAPQPGDEARVAGLLQGVLGGVPVGALDNFFHLGGNSLLALRALSALRQGGYPLATVAMMFADPTPRALAQALAGGAAPAPRRRVAMPSSAEPVAIVGMAGRFPGAPDISAFWRMLDEGREAIRFFQPHELDSAVPAGLRADPAYVPARGVIDEVELFDAGFFGISPREAELMDPQQRVFLELAWHGLEDAGHVPEKYTGTIGVFAGMYNASYFQRHVLAHPDKVARLGEFQVMLANEKDYIATRTAHKLGLMGPAVSVHTACSTSLVAIAQAFDALRAGQCDMALAGGASITCPPASGYLYQEGSMLSPDGHTRSFDAQAQGTVFSDGAAVVVLKRLPDALVDGDTIHAVLRSVAVNNDGAAKASFTAPGVDGQAAVIGKALAMAGVSARDISYVEAHGTATPLGDPIEVAALTQAFRADTADSGYCRLGSVKSNTGHMVIAAGAAGVIKTALALAHERLPGTLHFQQANPKLELASSPFRVTAKATPWPRGAQVRLAGVSSFGVGGTNAHAVVQEAPAMAPSPPAQGVQLLRLSARSNAALQRQAQALAAHLQAHPALNLADVAHTLAVGRREFAHRGYVAAASCADAVALLHNAAGTAQRAGPVVAGEPSLVWVFPGQGAQYAGMGRQLHAQEPAFRVAFDEVMQALCGHGPAHLQASMFGDDAVPLARTELTQPATFALEYALARTWQARGLQPAALVGHSVGEFVAAVLAGVMPLADAARLVARRGALMQALPEGAMLSVRMAADALAPLLGDELQLAAVNAPQACVVAGPPPAVQALAVQLERQGVVAKRLATSHAFHSAMMDPAVAPFAQALNAVPLAAPRLRIASTVTGTWLDDDQAQSAQYWAHHLRATVQFSQAVATVLADLPQALVLEVGPRASLSAMVRQQRSPQGPVRCVASLADQPDAELQQLADAAGQLWCEGLSLPWGAQPTQGRRRISLPGTAFERQRHWVDAAMPPGVELALAPPCHDKESEPAILPAMTTPTDRRPALLQRLKATFEDVSGVELADADPQASFVALGLDSLTLTQVALQLKKAFGVPVTFRQLMEAERSFSALSAHLDAKLPPEAAAAPAPAVAAAALAVPALGLPTMAVAAGPGNPLVQQVIQQQMLLMAQQLALLQGQPLAAVTVPASLAPASAPAAAAAPADDEAALAHSTYDVKKAFGAIARIHTAGTEVSERQRVRLDAFMRRYIAKTAKSKAYTVQHRKHLADPRVVNGFRPGLKEIIYQIVIERSKGARMWDLDGNEYVDALNGFGMNLFGWQPDFVADAVRKQLDSGYDIGPQHPLAGVVAEQACRLTGFDRAGLCNTGSEAVMGCVRIARTVTGRNRIVMFTGAYHGIFDEVIVRGTKKGKALPAAPGIMANTAENVTVLDYGTPETLQWLQDHADELAAVLVEPVQSRRPDFQPLDFLRELRALTEKAGALLIFDEVVTGFRSHPGGVQARFGIRADLASYGKVVGGGFPIGIIAGKREYMDALDGGHWEYGDDSIPTVGVTYFAGTFVRHPLALAAAHAVLSHIEAAGPSLQQQLDARTQALVDALNAHCQAVGAPIVLKCFSSVWKVFFTEDHPLQDLLFAMMRNRGVHILDNFPCFMTTAHSDADLAVIENAFKDAVAELQQAEFIPARSFASGDAFDASKPPVPGARLGKDPTTGKPAWFVANPQAPGRYMKVTH